MKDELTLISFLIEVIVPLKYIYFILFSCVLLFFLCFKIKYNIYIFFLKKGKVSKQWFLKFIMLFKSVFIYLFSFFWLMKVFTHTQKKGWNGIWNSVFMDETDVRYHDTLFLFIYFLRLMNITLCCCLWKSLWSQRSWELSSFFLFENFHTQKNISPPEFFSDIHNK